MKKISALIILFVFMVGCAHAKNPINTKAKMNTSFNSEQGAGIVEFINQKPITVSYIDIPENALVKVEVSEFQKEKRWHKSGFIIARLLEYTIDNKTYDVSEPETYLTLRKYEPLDKKEAAITAAEWIIMGGASFFAPGVDVGYFFLKGAITRKKDPNWFKAGVSNAYDNSIFWFILKGRPIELNEDDEISVKYIEFEKARNKSAKITYAKDKAAFKKEKKIVISQIKELKSELKKEEKADEKVVHAKIKSKDEQAKYEKEILKEHRQMAKMMKKTLHKKAKLARQN